QPGKCLVPFTEACEDQSDWVSQVRALLRRLLERPQHLARFRSTTGLGVRTAQDAQPVESAAREASRGFQLRNGRSELPLCQVCHTEQPVRQGEGRVYFQSSSALLNRFVVAPAVVQYFPDVGVDDERERIEALCGANLLQRFLGPAVRESPKRVPVARGPLPLIQLDATREFP